VKPWERLTGEPETAFAAFGVFLGLAKVSVNSLEFSKAVREQTGVELAPGTLGFYQTEYRWRERKRAYQSALLTNGMKGVTQSLKRESLPLARAHKKARNLVRKKMLEAAEAIERFTDDADSRQFNGYLDALDKLMNLALKIDIDHRDQLKRLLSECGSIDFDEHSESEEVIPPIPPESGSVQYGHPEAESVLGTPAGDMPGDSGPVHSDSPGDHG
jgi:hypothetical protein